MGLLPRVFSNLLQAFSAVFPLDSVSVRRFVRWFRAWLRYPSGLCRRGRLIRKGYVGVKEIHVSILLSGTWFG